VVPGLGTVTSERIYSSVDYVDVQGVQPDDRVSIQTAGFDFQDLTTLVPLWAASLARLAQELIQRNLHDPNATGYPMAYRNALPYRRS
jgi:hypothetical protein